MLRTPYTIRWLRTPYIENLKKTLQTLYIVVVKNDFCYFPQQNHRTPYMLYVIIRRVGKFWGAVTEDGDVYCERPTRHDAVRAARTLEMRIMATEGHKHNEPWDVRPNNFSPDWQERFCQAWGSEGPLPEGKLLLHGFGPEDWGREWRKIYGI